MPGRPEQSADDNTSYGSAMPRIAFAIVSAAALTLAAHAAPGPQIDGVYDFAATAQKNGKTVCAERWTFTDGIQTVESGEEVTTQYFHTETDADGQAWLVTTKAGSNGKPDCLGKRTPGAINEKEEKRTAIVVRNNGAFALCPDPVKTKDGTPYIGDCWGEATPAR